MHLPVAWSSASDVIITVVVVCCYYCNHGTHATCHSWPVRTAIVSRETDTPHYPAIEGGGQSTGNFPLCNTGMEKVWKAVLPYVPCDGDWLSGRVTANQEAVCCVCGNRPGGGGRGRGDSGFQGVLRNRAKKAPEVFTAPAHHSSSVLLLNSHSFFLRLGGGHVPQLRNRIVTLNVGTRASASKSSNCPMSLFLWCAVGGWSRDSSFENDEQTSCSAIIHKDNRWITSLISCVFSIVRLRAFSDEMRVRVSQKHAAIELRCFFANFVLLF